MIARVAIDAVEAPPDACATTISGTVTAPNGTLPLYNVSVYVPAHDPGPLATTLGCRTCDLQGGALASTATDVSGRFQLAVPAGDVPVVIQAGKWRRRLVVPVAACTDTPLSAVDTRLPSSRHDASPLTALDTAGTPEVDLPTIAISTGVSDAVECLVLQLGIDPSEITSDTGGGHVQLYTNRDAASGPANARGTDHFVDGTPFGDAQALWGSFDQLSRYDLVMLGCEGGQFPATKPQAALDAMKQYADGGGRVFLTHLQNLWLTGEPAWASVATFDPDVNGSGNAMPVTVDELANPQGPAYAGWLLDNGASVARDEVYVDDLHAQCVSIDTSVATPWLSVLPSEQTEFLHGVELFDVGTPIGARCGDVVYADMHVAYGSLSKLAGRVPAAMLQGETIPAGGRGRVPAVRPRRVHRVRNLRGRVGAPHRQCWDPPQRV